MLAKLIYARRLDLVIPESCSPLLTIPKALAVVEYRILSIWGLGQPEWPVDILSAFLRIRCNYKPLERILALSDRCEVASQTGLYPQ